MTVPSSGAGPATRTHTVAPAEAGRRLDRVLADALPSLSRNRIQSLIRDGCVSTDGRTITDPSHRVKQGQTFATFVPEIRPPIVEPQAIALTVAYEDEDLLVIDKPAGMVVHPGAGRPDLTLVNALLAYCGNSLSGMGGLRRPGIVHRLDKDTSGLIVVAKNDGTHAALSAQFAARTVDRAYRAVVWGLPRPPDGEIAGNIGRDPRNRQRMAVVTEGRGKPALTRYRTERRFGPSTGPVASLLECRLATGRTHQIRVHLAHRNHPLIGDPVYGRLTPARLKGLSAAAQETIRGFRRQALHAALLGFDHPRKRERLRFESGTPSDMNQLIESLETV